MVGTGYSGVLCNFAAFEPRCYNLAVSIPLSPSESEFIVTGEETGSRLDRVVAAHSPGVSRTRIQELIESACVLVDGKPAKVSHHLHEGERVSVHLEPRPQLAAAPESIPLEILYEDSDVIAINKPAGMTVHAGAGAAHGTLVNALLGRGLSLSTGGDALRPGIVHRLDKDTSGIILVAKNDAAHAKLAEAFRERAVEKTYLALVQGFLREERGRIDLAIARDPKRRVRMTARTASKSRPGLAKSREALTEWTTLARVGPATLASVQLHTGRTHQIRVHFSAIKHPVVGDTLYGAPAQLRIGKITLPPLGRNFLHAARIAFAQPTTGRRIELRSPLPSELRLFLQKLSDAAGENFAAIDAALAGYL
ncbi:MAG TPA: RluA family pseudouridine synthase [Candidatus Acidoferrales bacterium]|nr:RluA family pseudouridine synthase [Candidatus Acidoferrales bacterium]